MKNVDKHSAVLILEDGTIYRGKACGAVGTTTGEICFNTSMTGYQELFTDPSYFGQILVATNVHIGNYGIAEVENESSNIQISGLICKTFDLEFSRYKADISIQEYFENEGLVGISEVDTRAIVRKIRDAGSMNAIISSEELDEIILQEKLKEVPSMVGLELATKVSTKLPYQLGNPASEHKVAVLDYGTKLNILRNFTDRNCLLKVFPATSTLEDIQEWSPDAYFLSNGPGDPAAMDYAIELSKSLIETGKPVFGICLGHQLIALASDLKTYKMHLGHRGGNHPVIDLQSRKGEITTQNHGFTVVEKGIEDKNSKLKVTHRNLNDNTIEGLERVDKPVFSVQYHPEAAPGPHDSRYLFDKYVDYIKKSKSV